MDNKIFDVINQLSTYLSKIPDLNCGGCALTSYYIARELKKKNIECSLVLVRPHFIEMESFDEIDKEDIRDYDDYVFHCSHCYIEIILNRNISLSINRDGYNDRSFSHISLKYPQGYNLLKRSVNYNIDRQYNLWNTYFDRWKHSNKLRCAIRYYINKLDVSD